MREGKEKDVRGKKCGRERRKEMRGKEEGEKGKELYRREEERKKIVGGREEKK